MIRRCVALAALIAAASSATAAISGFGDFSGFTINQTDGQAAPTVSIPGGSIHLTSDVSDEARNIFTNTPQNVGQFTVSFVYQALNISNFFESFEGVAFVIQNSTSGNHVMSNVSGIDVGYSNITNSIGVSLELSDYLDNISSLSDLFTGGNSTSSSGNVSPVDLFAGHPIDVTLTYNGSILHENLTDSVTLASYDAYYVTNIPSLVGGSTAYVGITAGTDRGADQYISNFQFSSAVPEPASVGVMAAGGLLLASRRRKG